MNYTDLATILALVGFTLLVLLICERIESAKWKKLQEETQDKFVAEQTKRLTAWQMYERRKTDPDACVPFTREEATRDDSPLIGEPITENITFKDRINDSFSATEREELKVYDKIPEGIWAEAAARLNGMRIPVKGSSGTEIGYVSQLNPDGSFSMVVNKDCVEAAMLRMACTPYLNFPAVEPA